MKETFLLMSSTAVLIDLASMIGRILKFTHKSGFCRLNPFLLLSIYYDRLRDDLPRCQLTGGLYISYLLLPLNDPT